MSYPGGKSGAGVYQTIINQMPPHDVYIEPFVGGGGVLKNKRPAAANIAIDLSDDAAAIWQGRSDVTFLQGCGIQFLTKYKFTGRELVYLDPPYLIAARKSQREIYKHELGDMDHAWLLEVIRELPCMVMISGYASQLYDQKLNGWRRIEFQAATRQGMATEVLWMNFPQSAALHDYRHLGADYRERERIKRKVARWRAKFAGTAVIERQAILSALLELPSPETTMRPGISSEMVVIDHEIPAGIAANGERAREKALDPIASSGGAR